MGPIQNFGRHWTIFCFVKRTAGMLVLPSFRGPRLILFFDPLVSAAPRIYPRRVKS